MREQELLEVGPPKVEGRRESKASVIRGLIGRMIDINEMEELTGFNKAYIVRVVSKYPSWVRKKRVRDSIYRANNLLRGEKISVHGRIVIFLEYTKSHVYFVNGRGKIENSDKEEFVESLAESFMGTE